MLRKVFWSVFSLLMVVLLILVSCGPRAAPTPATPVPGTPAPAAPTPVPLTPAPVPATTAEKPKYGGTINILIPNLGSSGENFVPLLPGQSMWGESWVLEQMLSADYTRSMAGTGENDLAWGYGGGPAIPSWEHVVGSLAESFEMPANGVWVLNVRKGVHFALDPASEASRFVNGREMTADDVKFSFEIMRDTPNSRTILARPEMMKNMTAEKTGPWQVTVRTPVDAASSYLWLMGGGGVQFIWPKEWLEKYGKINEWRNMVGTGPYMLADFVSGSVVTLKRNPNYWDRSRLGPGKGDQLPYLDGVKIFLIPDLSTRLATMRTGKGDIIEGIQYEDAKNLMASRPSLKSVKYLAQATSISMRTDKEDLPYKDVRVRQALMMATDLEAIKRDLYGDQAEILTLPVNSTVKQLYRPLAELPAAVQALYKYNPERAKQLLAEAGYPSGFKARMLIPSVTTDLDLASVVKSMWAKVGVDLEIQPREFAVWRANSLTYDELYFNSGTGTLTLFSTRYSFTIYRGRSANASYVNEPPGKDPVIEKAFQTVSTNYMANPPKADQALRELIPYILEQAYYLELPSAYIHRVWQPWVKGYYGEHGLGATAEPWAPYPWVDQDLKEQMTGRR